MANKDLTVKNMSSLLDQFFGDAYHSFRDMFTNRWLSVFDDDWYELTLPKRGGFPKVNVSESDEKYDVEIAISGFGKDEVDLELDGNKLCIRAASCKEKKDEEKKYLVREISSRSFCRVVNFPVKVDTEKVEATYKDGVILVSVPKVQNAKIEPLKIEIK